MRKTALFFLALGLLSTSVMCKQQAGKETAGKGSQPGAAGSAIRFKTFSYADQQGIGIEAFKMLIPAEWQFEGGIRWVLDNPGMPAAAAFKVRSPSGKEEFEVFPNQPFFWTNNQMLLSTFPVGTRYFGNEVRPLVGAVEALKQIVLPRFRQNVGSLRIVQEQPLPELAKALGAGAQSQPGITTSADGAKLRIEYQQNGTPMEEEIFGVVESLSFPLQTMYGMVTNTNWYVDYIFSFKAEKGKLDSNAKMFQTIAYSFQLNPLWFSKYNQVVEYLIRQQIQQIHNIGQLSRIISQTSNEISEMNMRSWEQRQAVNDKIADNFSQYIRGVDKYYDPYAEKPVELPAGYDNAWSNNLGEYVVSDSPSFNPNIGSNLNWQKMNKP